MTTIDDNVQVGLELTTTSLQLSAKLIIALMDLFLNQKYKKNSYQDLSNKQGKQKLKDLFEKKENMGIEPLEGNLSKEEIKNIQKELKSMGVDFSIQKVNKDEYSLFFAGKDREAIEKGMENSISKYAKRQKGKDKVKNLFKSNDKKQPSFKIDELQEKSIKRKEDQIKEKIRVKKPNHSL